VGLTGAVLTKLDGDTRGGAAISVHVSLILPLNLSLRSFYCISLALSRSSFKAL
jgi:hypothetical protein